MKVIILEDWQSGLLQRFAKPSSPKGGASVRI